MQSTKTRYLKTGADVDYLFPRAALTDLVIKRGATVADTVKFIPEAVRKSRWQTQRLTATLFTGYDLEKTCRRIVDFVYDHINYLKDEDGREMIRSPRRTWHERFRGVDCDCYTTFISTILYNLGIRHKLRIAKYSEDHFQHIYPIVPLPQGGYLTLDCVPMPRRFNYEEPYTEINDTNMNLEFLDGIPEDEDMLGIDEIQGLQGKTKIGKALKQGLHSFNRVNPATLALRNGLLAAMKLNTLHIAGRLKWSYLTPQQAIAKGIDPVKHRKLGQVRQRLEKIFYGAGGKEKNLRSAILNGKGNKGRPVQGLGYTDYTDISGLDGMDEDTPLRTLLGHALWESENISGMEGVYGLEGMGELGAGVAIATTTAALAAVNELLNKIGDIVPAKKAPTPVPGPTPVPDNSSSFNEASEQESPAPDSDGDIPEESQGAEALPAELPATDQSEEEGGEALSGTAKISAFWEKNKRWMKPTMWGIGGLGLLYLGLGALSSANEKSKTESSSAQAQLTGTPAKGKKKKKKASSKKSVRSVELM